MAQPCYPTTASWASQSSLPHSADAKPRKTDVRYLGWGSAVGGNWFPQTIEVWDGDRLVRRSITKNVERNISFDATLFTIR